MAIAPVTPSVLYDLSRYLSSRARIFPAKMRPPFRLAHLVPNPANLPELRRPVIMSGLAEQ